MDEPERPPTREEEPADAAGWLEPFFRDPTLWPVLAVVVIIFVVLGAAGLLLAVVERNPFAVGAMLVLFFIGLDASLRERRRGERWLVTGCAAGFWLLSGLAAAVARWSGWF